MRPTTLPSEKPQPFIRPQYQRNASGTTTHEIRPPSIHVHTRFNVLFSVKE